LRGPLCGERKVREKKEDWGERKMGTKDRKGNETRKSSESIFLATAFLPILEPKYLRHH